MVQEENVHLAVHQARVQLVVDVWVHWLRHHLVELQIVYNHLLLDCRSFPIELVECVLEELALYSRVKGLGPS